MSRIAKCQLCENEFELPEDWDSTPTIIQQTGFRYFETATVCKDCTPKYFRSHRAIKTKSCFPVFINED